METALGPDRLDAYETANRYHFYSCFFLFGIGGLRERFRENPRLNHILLRAQTVWGWGTLVFCGSVYLVAVRGLIGLENAAWLGAVAPIGGLLLITGAALAAWGIARN